MNGVLGYDDVSALAVATSSGTSANHPISLVQNTVLSRYAEFSSTSGDATLTWDVGQDVRLVVVFTPEATAGDGLALEISSTTSPGLGDVFDAALPSVDPRYCYSFALLSAQTTVRSLRLTCNGAYPTRVGRIWVGKAFQPAVNFILGYGEKWTDASVVSEAQDSGAREDYERPSRRVFDFAYDRLSPAEAAIAREIDRKMKSIGQCAWIPDPAAADVLETLSLGRITNSGSMLMPEALFIDGAPARSKTYEYTEDL